MTLALDRYKTAAIFQRCLIRITLRQQLPGLITLAALWLLPFLTVLYWLRWTEYPLTQISPDAYGGSSYSSYWAAHWNHVGDFDSVLYGLVALTSVACLLLLIPATTLIRRDLLVRLNVVLWTQGASAAQWLLAKVAVLGAFVVVCFGTTGVLDWSLLHWAASRHLLVDDRHNALLMQGIGPSLVAAALMYVCVGALFAVIPGDRINRSFCRLGLLFLLLGLDSLAKELFSGTGGMRRTLITHRISGVNRSKSVLTGVNPVDYWLHQLLNCTYDLAIAAGALLLALHLLRRRTVPTHASSGQGRAADGRALASGGWDLRRWASLIRPGETR